YSICDGLLYLDTIGHICRDGIDSLFWMCQNTLDFSFGRGERCRCTSNQGNIDAPLSKQTCCCLANTARSTCDNSMLCHLINSSLVLYTILQWLPIRKQQYR